MRRREFIVGSASIALWPFPAFAEQAHPRIGFLHQGDLPSQPLIAAFRAGLREGGESPDVEIEHRPANGDYSRLSALAADLVNRQVSVIAAELLPAGLAAKAATKTIPIVFLTGSDPIGSGLVSSIARPETNVTGIAFLFTRLGQKNLELLRQLAPKHDVIGALANPSNPSLGRTSKMPTEERALWVDSGRLDAFVRYGIRQIILRSAAGPAIVRSGRQFILIDIDSSAIEN